MPRSCRSRLCLADDIESIERRGNKCRLNGAGCKVADLLEGSSIVVLSPMDENPICGFLLLNSSNQSILRKQSFSSLTIS